MCPLCPMWCPIHPDTSYTLCALAVLLGWFISASVSSCTTSCHLFPSLLPGPSLVPSLTLWFSQIAQMIKWSLWPLESSSAVQFQPFPRFAYCEPEIIIIVSPWRSVPFRKWSSYCILRKSHLYNRAIFDVSPSQSFVSYIIIRNLCQGHVSFLLRIVPIMFLYLSMSRSLVTLLALLALCIYCAQENGQWKLGNLPRHP